MGVTTRTPVQTLSNSIAAFSFSHHGMMQETKTMTSYRDKVETKIEPLNNFVQSWTAGSESRPFNKTD
jgi:hypothetical protein